MGTLLFKVFGFASAKSLAKHEEYCEKNPVARRVLPEPEKAILQ